MSETSTQIAEEKPKRSAKEKRAEEEKSSSVGWGVFLVLAGLALFAKEMGWISISLGWLLPAVLVAIGASYLYHGFKR